MSGPEGLDLGKTNGGTARPCRTAPFVDMGGHEVLHRDILVRDPALKSLLVQTNNHCIPVERCTLRGNRRRVRPVRESASLESLNKDIHHHELPCISMRLSLVQLHDPIFQSPHEAEIPAS